MEFLSEKNITVCFFDSGIGGLNLLCECAKKLPHVNFKYFADNFNVPYGSLSREQIIERADAFFSEIQKLKPSAAVIACNTVTAQAAEFLRAKYSFPIVGVQPAVKPAAESGGDSLVLATEATAYSESIQALIEKYGGGVTKVAPCPDLAPYIEKNIFSLDEKKVFLMLPPIQAQNVVLGCTHYTFVKDFIKLRYNCKVFDGIEGTAHRLCKILGIYDHLDHQDAHLNKNGHSAPDFEEIAAKVEFIGGDERKNSDVFRWLVGQSGYFSSEFPKKIKK